MCVWHKKRIKSSVYRSAFRSSYTRQRLRLSTPNNREKLKCVRIGGLMIMFEERLGETEVKGSWEF